MISRMTPTGILLTLEAKTEPSNKFEVAATLVADRVFDLASANAPAVNASGDVSYNQLRDALAKMLAEGSLKAEVQWA